MNNNPFENKECEIFSDNRRIINVEENKRKYIAHNQSENVVCLIRVDNCLIKDGIKCDFLLLNISKAKSYFIELKGSDLIHALEQINRTIDVLVPFIKEYSVNVRIVLTKVFAPDLRSNQYKQLERKLKKLNGNIQKKEKVLNEEI
jgi:hypothetical protein